MIFFVSVVHPQPAYGLSREEIEALTVRANGRLRRQEEQARVAKMDCTVPEREVLAREARLTRYGASLFFDMVIRTHSVSTEMKDIYKGLIEPGLRFYENNHILSDQISFEKHLAIRMGYDVQNRLNPSMSWHAKFNDTYFQQLDLELVTKRADSTTFMLEMEEFEELVVLFAKVLKMRFPKDEIPYRR